MKFWGQRLHTSKQNLFSVLVCRPHHLPPRGVEYYNRHTEYSEYKQDINANHRGNSFIATASPNYQGSKKRHGRHSNYVATQIGSNNVQYDVENKPAGRSMPVAVSNYSIHVSKKQDQHAGKHSYHVGRSGSVPVGISNILTSPTSVAKQQQYVPSHSSIHVASSNHSIASVAGIDPYSNQSNYSLCSITSSPQYIGASNSVIHTAPSNHSLTTIAHASDYTGLPTAPANFGLPLPTVNKSHPLSIATSNSKSQSELRHSASTPTPAHGQGQAPPVPPKPKRHSDGLDSKTHHLDNQKKVTNGLSHSQSYSEAMLRKTSPQPIGGSNPGSCMPHTTDSVSVTDYKDYMPLEGVLVPVSSGTSLIVHESGPEGKLQFSSLRLSVPIS